MNKQRIGVFLLAVFLISLLAPAMAMASANTSITNLTVRPELITIGENSKYNISFISNAALTGGIDTVQIRFPSEYRFSNMSWYEGYVDINGQASGGVSYSNGLLVALVPRNMSIYAGQTVSVGLSSSIMRNPDRSGEYSFSVNTSKETSPIASPRFAISEFVHADGVSKPHVTMKPVKGYQAEEIGIRFTANRNGQLIGSVGQIVLDFPSGFRLPQNIDEKTITINGIQMHSLSPVTSGARLILPMSPTMNFPEYHDVEIILAANSGITVDRDIADAVLFISTTSNTAAVESFSFGVNKTPDRIYQPPDEKDPGVSVIPNGAGVVGQWVFTFPRNSILLTEGDTVIGFTVNFPSGTILPGAIAPQNITVNGQQSTGVLVDPARREVIFNLPIGFSVNLDLSIVISASAGIQNPPAAVYLMEITPRGSTRRMPTKTFEIKAVSDPVPVTPPTVTPATDRVVKVTIDDPVGVKDGLAIILDVAPQLIDGFTMVPLRFVTEGLGAGVEYDSTQNTVTLTLGARTIVLWPGSTLAKVDNTVVTLAKAPIIRNDRTMVPVRFVSECFGAKVDFVSVTEPITITMTADALSRMPTVAEIQAAQAGAASGGTGAGTGAGAGGAGTGAGEAGSGSGSGAASGGGESQGAGGGAAAAGKTIVLAAGHNNANLRKGPGVNHELVGMFLPTETATILEISSADGEGFKWYHVEFEYGLQAWIREDLAEVK
ncbi:MAG: stalk domain-containing protein [Clostridiales bacterium]|nr:stalk domain-containing protein [Clostridiales bacterium]